MVDRLTYTIHFEHIDFHKGESNVEHIEVIVEGVDPNSAVQESKELLGPKWILRSMMVGMKMTPDKTVGEKKNLEPEK